MEMSLSDATQILKRTPIVLTHLLRDLPEKWARATEGGDIGQELARLGLQRNQARSEPTFDPFAKLDCETSRTAAHRSCRQNTGVYGLA